MKILTLKQLLAKWHTFKEPITRSDIETLDWDELMLMLNISCPQAEDSDYLPYHKRIIIVDVDMATYHNPAVIFDITE